MKITFRRRPAKTGRHLTQAEINLIAASMDTRFFNQAYRRQPESRWWIAAGLFLLALIIIVATSSALPGGW